MIYSDVLNASIKLSSPLKPKIVVRNFCQEKHTVKIKGLRKNLKKKEVVTQWDKSSDTPEMGDNRRSLT